MRRALLLLLFASSLYATDYRPWFSPLWEFQGRASYLFDCEERIQTPKGSFDASTSNHTFHTSLTLTPWPYWSGEVELYLSGSSRIPFSYEAAFGTVRYQWLNDIRGDCITLVTGLTLSFPGSHFLHDFSYAYHGEVNGELHVTVGKEWACGRTWWTRGWALAGWGIANQGNSWFHGIAAWEFHPRCLELGAFAETLIGFGSDDIIPNAPFTGYATIGHRTVDLGAFLRYQMGYFGTLSLYGWGNAYAHNFVEHNWGGSVRLLIPFSL